MSEFNKLAQQMKSRLSEEGFIELLKAMQESAADMAIEERPQEPPKGAAQKFLIEKILKLIKASQPRRVKQ